MTRNNNRFIPVQGSFLRYHFRTPSSPRRDRLTRCHPPSRSESSPALKPPLFSISRMSRPSTAQEPLSGSTTHGSGRVERWIDDQRGEDQDPRRLSPMPRHSDTIVHSRRLNTPVKPRTPVSHRDGSDFVFVDDDDDDVSECTKSPDGDMCSNQVRVSVLPLRRVKTRCQAETSGIRVPLPAVVELPVCLAALPPRLKDGGCRLHRQ